MNYSNQANYFWGKKKSWDDMRLKHGAFKRDITIEFE